MVVLLIQMKLAVLRHSITGQRAAQMFTGALAGLVLAAGLIMLAGRDHPVASLPFDLIGAGFALWMVGWLLGPALFGGGDEMLRPEHFSLLSFTPRRLAAGLTGAAFVGVAPAVTLVAFAALVVLAVKAELGVAAMAVGVLAVPLQLVLCVLASRLVTAALGQVMRSKTGAALAALVSAAILAALHSGWVLSPLVQSAPPCAPASPRPSPPGSRHCPPAGAWSPCARPGRDTGSRRPPRWRGWPYSASSVCTAGPSC